MHCSGVDDGGCSGGVVVCVCGVCVCVGVCVCAGARIVILIILINFVVDLLVRRVLCAHRPGVGAAEVDHCAGRPLHRRARGQRSRYSLLGLDFGHLSRVLQRAPMSPGCTSAPTTSDRKLQPSPSVDKAACLGQPELAVRLGPGSAPVAKTKES